MMAAMSLASRLGSTDSGGTMVQSSGSGSGLYNLTIEATPPRIQSGVAKQEPTHITDEEIEKFLRHSTGDSNEPANFETLQLMQQVAGLQDANLQAQQRYLSSGAQMSRRLPPTTVESINRVLGPVPVYAERPTLQPLVPASQGNSMQGIEEVSSTTALHQISPLSAAMSSNSSPSSKLLIPLLNANDDSSRGSSPVSQTPSSSSNRSSRKKKPSFVPPSKKDQSYWDRRRKNNDSARRSRESRRLKEEQIAMRVVYLEQENLQLRTEVGLLRAEIEKLRCMLYANNR